MKNNFRWHSKKEGWKAFSLSEILVVVAILAIAARIVVSGYIRERNRNLAYTAANNIAGWIEATRRSAERGSACLMTLYPSSNITASYTLATGSLDTGATTSILNPCQSANPLRIDVSSDRTVFNVSATPITTMVFTPRGTVFNPGSTEGELSSPLRIGVNVMRSGSIQPPTYCVVVSPPLGSVDVIFSGTTTC